MRKTPAQNSFLKATKIWPQKVKKGRNIKNEVTNLGDVGPVGIFNIFCSYRFCPWYAGVQIFLLFNAASEWIWQWMNNVKFSLRWRNFKMATKMKSIAALGTRLYWLERSETEVSNRYNPVPRAAIFFVAISKFCTLFIHWRIGQLNYYLTFCCFFSFGAIFLLIFEKW